LGLKVSYGFVNFKLEPLLCISIGLLEFEVFDFDNESLASSFEDIKLLVLMLL